MILDLHIHSKYSYDSTLDAKTILKTAKLRRLDGVAITDHDTIAGGLEAKKMNSDPNFSVIVGSEVSTDAGDLIGLFLTEEVKSHGMMEAIEEIRKQGGIAILPHPYRGHRILGDEVMKRVDLIEAYNSRSNAAENKKAAELAERFGKQTAAGSDAHFRQEIGLGKITIEDAPPGDLQTRLLHGKNTVGGLPSPTYLRYLSQTIKAAKEKKYAKVPYYLARSAYHYVR
jgi:hypothetical protein